MSCPTSICNETCPAAISTINIVTNTVSLGDDTVVPVSQHVYPSGSIIMLPSNDVPIAGTFKLFKNGQLLTADSDYSLADDVATLVMAPVSTDVYVVDYIAVRA